jgi:hypothetical protein
MKQLSALIWGIGIGVVFMGCPCFAKPVDVNKLADAIYKAEGEAKTSHPYGILTHYKRTSPRQACINTINHQLKKWKSAGSKGDFIEILAKTYCPLGARNDTKNLNKNWTRNVRYFYERSIK